MSTQAAPTPAVVPGATIRLGVVVVNYGSSALLARHLVEIDTTDGDVTVVVVDNWSSAAELAAIRELTGRQGWELLASATNVGFGAACNLGAERAVAAGCEALLFLNPDARVSTVVARQLAAACLDTPRSLISPMIHRGDGSVWFRGSELDLATGGVRAVRGEFTSGADRWLTGACLALSVSWWTELGGFADDFFLYWEDVDLSRRCVERGGVLVMMTAASAVHDPGGTQTGPDEPAESGKSAVYFYFNCRNRLLFAARHLTARQMLKWLVATPQQSTAILLRGGRRPLLRHPSLILAAVRGSVVGSGRVLGELARRAAARWGATGSRPAEAALVGKVR